MCVRAHADTLIDNRFYVVFSPVVRKSHTCSFKKEATSLPARRQLKTYDYNKEEAMKKSGSCLKKLSTGLCNT